MSAAYPKCRLPAPFALGGRRLFAFVFGILALTGVAIAYQVNTSTSGTGPVVKTYPSTLTATYTITGSNSSINQPSVALDSFGAVTSAQLSPTIAASTDAIRARITASGCTLAMGRCSNVGTLTIAFNKPVTNPVLHISGLGGVVTGTGLNSQFSASMVLTGSSGSLSTPSLSFLNGTSNFQVSGGNEIRTPTVNGAVNCNVTPTAGCGSVRVNGTVSSLTFRLDLLMGGTTDPSAAAAESFTITTSVDEDFGDAPSAYQASPVASHIVGGVYMGAGITADNTNTVNGNPQATSPIANATASSDGNDDGVTFPILVRGTTGNLIRVAVSGAGGRLQGWIDWAADNSFATAGDQIATNAIDGGSGDNDGVANGIIQLSVNPPSGTTQLTTRARFRYSTTAGLGINGVASDGEVEDYQVILYPQRNDLSLTKSVSNASPTTGSSVSYTLTLTSAALSTTSNTTSTGITVQDTLPSGFSFSSASGTGTYNSSTGVWSVGALDPGASATLTINGTVSALGGTVTNVAQVSASSITDPDSTPNNGVTIEDDYATAAFSVPNILPAPSCSVGTTNQIITNGNFSSGTGPSWTGWTAGSVWVGSGVASADNNTTSGNLTQSGLSGLSFGPSSGNGAVLQLSAWWRNGAPAAGSTTALLRVFVAGTEYARISSDSNAGTIANVTYYNGASGNLTTITEFTSTGWRINLPTTVTATGALQFTFTPGGGTSDDYEIDNVALYTCNPWADLSLNKTVSNATPVQGSALSYTLTASSAAASVGTATGITVQDTLPAGFTFTSASGTGTYNSGTGIWSVGSLAPNTSAAITINGTASGTAGVAVTNVAQISASSLFDPDSTVNNGVTTEDDYATVAFTPTPGVINCPTGSTSTGSGFASGGTGLFQSQIFWLDWSCGGTTSFPAGSTINKIWDAGDGLIITGQVTNITNAPLSVYSTGGWGGDVLDNMYPGVNPLGLGGAGGVEPAFRVRYSATLNGVSVPLPYVTADAEDTSSGELMQITTSGSAWQLLETSGSPVVTLSGTTASWVGSGGSSNGSPILQTTGNSVELNASMSNEGGEYFAFGVFTPFDWSDAPLTGTSYGAANHRTIGTFDLGPGYTTEGSAYDHPTASADANDDGVTFPTLTPTISSPISIAAPNLGYLSAWIDWNNDGDFADAGEQVATDFVNGGTGDTDGAANGVITFNITPPAGVTQAFARFRLSSRTGAPSSGLHGFGEIEDYQIIITPSATLTLAKTSTTWDDGINPVFNLPGNDVMYSLVASNTTAGQPDTDSVFLYDTLPSQVTFYNGDADGPGAGTTAVLFTDSGSGLTFTYATDVRYSNTVAPPASFAACTYTPAAGYDANVKHVCINPKGLMNGKTGAPTPSFTLLFRARIQ